MLKLKPLKKYWYKKWKNESNERLDKHHIMGQRPIKKGDNRPFLFLR